MDACEEDAFDANDRIERVEADAPNVGDCTEADLALVTLAIESRLEYSEPAEEASDSFEARRERAAEIKARVSCSVMGEGPGTGGRGAEGGNVHCIPSMTL